MPVGIQPEPVGTAAPAAQGAALATSLVSPAPLRLQFTATGSEYFRIWVVNTLLSMLTLGVYSAWAKVRKTRYFWQNTRLDGFAFDYHGSPGAILRGRLLALVLLVLYSYGFQFSRAAGFTGVAILLLAGPWLFLKAQRFKLANTSWRGIRFGFDAGQGAAYRTATPILVLWFGATLLPNQVRPNLVGLAGAILAGFLPWMHHRLKAFQHAGARFGDRKLSFAPATRRFYGAYAKGLGLLVVGAIWMGIVTAIVAIALTQGGAQFWQFALLGSVGALFLYLVVGPYLAACLQEIIWSSTSSAGLRFHTEIRAWPLTKIAARNVVLTVLTAGLYWPFAAVAMARYRLECMTVLSETPLAEIAAGVRRVEVSAVGEGAADLFGLDIGL